MPVTPTYPGVYIQEVPSGVRTITGVATSIAAFVDYFKRGPLNKAVQVFNLGDFERIFGGLDRSSEASYAVQQFFLNGGTQAWIVRVASGDFRASAAEIGASIGGASIFTVEASDPGVWGDNLQIQIMRASATSFNLIVSEYSSGANRIVVRQEVFRNLTPANVQAIVNDAITGSKLIRVTVAAGIPLANGTYSGDHVDGSGNPLAPTIPADPSVSVAIQGITQTATLVFPTGTTFSDPINLNIIAPVLESAIRAADPVNLAFASATVEVVDNQLHVLAGSGQPTDIIAFANDGANTCADALLLTGAVTANIQAYKLGVLPSSVGAQVGGIANLDGNDGTLPDSAALIGDLVNKTGIHALEDVDLFNLLCIPRTAIVATSPTVGELTPTQAQAVMTVAERYCESRRAFFLMDTPKGINTFSGIRDWLQANTALRSNYAALYFPRVLIPDPLDDFRLKSIGASGTISGVCARTDSDRGVWKAPAGTEATLRNVTALEVTLTDPENGALNPLAINCLRNFPVYGTVCWGSRTLEGADQQTSEWKYVPVRRTALFIEESLYRGLKWVVFEPNDEPLWAQIRLNVGAFMNNLFRQGAFQGTTPREAYLVKCDKETTTQNDINLGIVNILVGFAPLKPAEFVIVNIQQLAGQIAV